MHTYRQEQKHYCPSSFRNEKKVCNLVKGVFSPSNIVLVWVTQTSAIYDTRVIAFLTQWSQLPGQGEFSALEKKKKANFINASATTNTTVS